MDEKRRIASLFLPDWPIERFLRATRGNGQTVAAADGRAVSGGGPLALAAPMATRPRVKA